MLPKALLPAPAAKRQNGVYIKPDIRRHAFELPIIRPMWRRAAPNSIFDQAMLQPAKKSGNPGCPGLPPLDYSYYRTMNVLLSIQSV
jgi:hypothetical protein